LINVFGIIREILLDEAKILLKHKIINNLEDIYYFSLDEIEQIIATNFMDEDLLKIRMATYEANSKLKPPRIFTGD
jgi:pyruvate,water dikinase